MLSVDVELEALTIVVRLLVLQAKKKRMSNKTSKGAKSAQHRLKFCCDASLVMTCVFLLLQIAPLNDSRQVSARLIELRAFASGLLIAEIIRLPA